MTPDGEPVRITHPFHPDSGQALEVLRREGRWGEDRVVYRSLHGHIASLPTAWTSLATEEPAITADGQKACFRVADLLELVDLLSELQR